MLLRRLPIRMRPLAPPPPLAAHRLRAAPPLPRSFVPDPPFEQISLGQPRLDCSEAGVDDDQELWLLQLPHDVGAAAGAGAVGLAGSAAGLQQG